MCSGDLYFYSFGEWLIPPALGTRIVPTRTASPPHGLAVLAMVRASPVDAVHRKVVRRGPPIEDRLGQAWVAREENALIAADGDAVHGSHIVALGLQRGADEREEIGFERE